MDFHSIRDLVKSSEDRCQLCSLILIEVDLEDKEHLWMELRNRGNVGEQMRATVWSPGAETRGASRPYKLMLRIEEGQIEPGFANA